MDQTLLRRRQGDAWRFRWELDADPDGELASWDESTLVAQLRAGTGTSAPVLASSEADTIVFTGTDLAADTPLLRWMVTAEATAAVRPGVYLLEVEIEIEGEPATIFSENITVLPQSAVAS